MSTHSDFQGLAKLGGIRFANSTDIYPHLHHHGDKGIPLLLVDNALGNAIIALHGAHVMSFRPAGQTEMLWLSPQCILEAGKPIRGGIPLCLPWFGPGADGKSMHGFARTAQWTLVHSEVVNTGATWLGFELQGDASPDLLWPHAFSFRLDVLAGSALTLGITVENRSDTVAPLGFAFHTYFAVPDVAQAVVAGLDGADFIDKIDNLRRNRQHGVVTIPTMTDRVYLDVAAVQTILTDARGIRIESDAQCAVVWNAGINDKNVPDIGEGNHVGYLCVERGDVADRAVTLPPGARYRKWMTLAIEPD